MKFLATFLIALALAAPADAQSFDGKRHLGYGTQFNNDTLADGRDRWQTGSYVVSAVRGNEWTGDLPLRMGEIVEYRLRGSLAAPESLTRPQPGDRRYAATLSFGVHSHFQSSWAEHSVGVDLVATGPMAGIGGIQSLIHDLLSGPSPAAAQANQIGNAVYPTATFEMGRTYSLGSSVTLRPFVETIVGVEVLARAGADVNIGSVWQGDLSVRDVITGHRYDGVRGKGTGFGLTVGGDFAAVASSAYFPAGGPAAQETRSRARAGLTYQGKRFGGFTGITYLSPEFKGQRSGQLVGTLRVNLSF